MQLMRLPQALNAIVNDDLQSVTQQDGATRAKHNDSIECKLNQAFMIVDRSREV